jgi:outer membrane receptor protein involved in Fe transport
VEVSKVQRVLLRVICATGLLVVAAPAGAQPVAETLRGRILDEQRAAIGGASVSVTCGATTKTGVTDATGQFAIAGLPAGRCAVSAESDLFARVTRDVTLPGDRLEAVLPVRAFVSNVVVTPSRGDRETAFDSPRAVSVVAQEDLRSRPFTLLGQALREEPGILVQQTTTAQVSPVIRGFTGQQNVYLIDGVRLNTSAWRGGPSQYFAWVSSSIADRLEVVRGPASVQYGSDALGGTIHVMPFQPAPGVGARVSGEVEYAGATADRSSTGAAHIALQQGSAALRVGVTGQTVGNLRGGDGLDSHAAVTRFLGLPSKDVFGSRMPSTGFDSGGAYASGSVRVGQSGLVTGLYLHNNLTGSSRYDRIDGGNGVYRSGFDPQRLDFAVFRYANRPASGTADWSAAVSVNRQADGRFEQARPTAVLDRQQAAATAIGYQLEGGKRLAAHQVRGGVELYRESISASREQVTLATGAVAPQRPDIPDGTTYDTFGVFVSDSLQIGRVGLRGGLRYGRYDFATVADTAHPAFGVVDEQVGVNAVTFSAGTVYSLTRSLNATFNVSRGFRAANSSDLASIGLSGGGGFAIAPSRAAALGGLVGSTGGVDAISTGDTVPALRPEILYAFEPGVRFRSGRYSASLTIFDLEYLDNFEGRSIVFPGNIVGSNIAGYDVVRQDPSGLAYIAQDTRPIRTSINVGHSRLVGFETEGGVEIARDWRARAYFSLSNGHVVGGDYISKMPPPLGGASLRWSPGRFWVEGTTMFARRQTRLSAADLTDARIGATRSRTQIASYFNGTAVDLGYVSNGILLATNETLAQVQTRVLGAAASAPMFTDMAGFVTVGARGGVSLRGGVELIVIGENLTDRNYRFIGSGADAPGANLQVRLRYAFCWEGRLMAAPTYEAAATSVVARSAGSSRTFRR